MKRLPNAMRMVWPFLMLLLISVNLSAQRQPPLTIAHRGGMAHRPENTLVAFEHAVKLGVDMLEFDMVVTSDDQVVIHHNLEIDQANCLANGLSAGPIRSLKLEQVQMFDCGSKRHPSFPKQALSPGARIPTLEEFLRAFKNRKVEFLGETKMASDRSPHFVAPRKFVQMVYRIIQKHGVQDRFILASADYRTLEEIRKLSAGIRTCLLNARRFKPDYVAAARRYGTTHLILRSDDLAEDDVPRLHAAGCRVFSSTADDIAQWRKYLQLGVDGILTNDPGGLIQFLNSEWQPPIAKVIFDTRWSMRRMVQRSVSSP